MRNNEIETLEAKLHEAAQEIETLKLAITPTHGTDWTTAQCATLAECHRDDSEYVDAIDDSGGSVDFDAVRLQRAARLATADAEIVKLTKREAECHDVLAGLLALHDPDEDSDLHDRADRILGAHDPDGHCGNPICAALLKAEAEVETLKAELARQVALVEFAADDILELEARLPNPTSWGTK